ncbi:MAG: glycosyltransferase family 2 protein [Candidatus Bathyarchaeia archaeon]
MTGERNGEVEVSLVFPAFNEVDRLEGAVLRVMEHLKKISRSFEVIIAEDGSTDGTDKLAEDLSKKYACVRHIHSDVRLGRGRALNRAFKMSRGEILIYTDVDLSTDPMFLEPLINSVRNGYDFVTGSRMLPDSVVERTSTRKFLSTVYNFMVRAFLRSPVRDHQCGFKAFRRSSLITILDRVKAKHWFWDTEVLVLAAYNGFKVMEIPVVWRSGERSKVRIISDIMDMGLQILKLWWRLNIKKN